jgi:hypothetical protein
MEDLSPEAKADPLPLNFWTRSLLSKMDILTTSIKHVVIADSLMVRKRNSNHIPIIGSMTMSGYPQLIGQHVYE